MKAQRRTDTGLHGLQQYLYAAPPPVRIVASDEYVQQTVEQPVMSLGVQGSTLSNPFLGSRESKQATGSPWPYLTYQVIGRFAAPDPAQASSSLACMYGIGSQ